MALPEHTVTWAELGPLRQQLAWAAVRGHAPLLLLSLAATWAWYGGDAWVRLLLAAVSTLALQVGVGVAASFMIMPGQRRMKGVLHWLVRYDEPGAGWLRRTLGAGLMNSGGSGALGGMLTVVEEQNAHAGRCRVDLLGAGLNGREHVVRTPDGVPLDVIVFGGGADRSPRGALIYCGGNMELCSLNRSWGSYAARHRVSVILFDYRGVGASGGTISRHGGVTDVACMVAFAQAVLGHPRERVLLFGHSIGGAFSAEAAAALPGVAVINDRSFGRLSETAWHHLLPHWCTAAGPDASTPAARLRRWLVSEAVRHVACWELDSGRAWLRIPNARKATVFHAGDAIIPVATQLRTHLVELYGFPASGGRALGAGGAEAEDAAAAAAAALLGFAPGCFGLGAVAQLGAERAAGGPREDAHNRELTTSEEARFFRGLVEPLLGYSSAPGGVGGDGPRACISFQRL
jgi:pimeloyl-ACP methyl ester carboxylesterase